MKIKTHHFQAGFTLVEILVVMAIIGILATIGLGSFQSSQQKGRDARRKNDLKQISNSLEAYYNDKHQYPLSSGDHKLMGCGSESTCEWGSAFTDVNGTTYMVTLPGDPSPNRSYYYESTDGTSYQLYARLENDLDASVPKDTSKKSEVYTGVTCGGVDCNYGVSSSNTSPVEGRSLGPE